MHTLPARALAFVLCCSPFFWTSQVALAQSFPTSATAQQSSGQAFPTPGGQPLEQAASLQPYTETGERTSRPTAPSNPSPAPVDAPLDPGRYLCGPGDLLDLNFWGLQNFTLRVPVDLEGRVFVPRVGYLTLAGKSLTAARALVREAVGRFYPRLTFDLALAEPRRFLVQVVDNVARPGSHPARAVDRVAAVIETAGGFGPHPSKRRVEVTRRDGTTLVVDLLRFAQTGDLAQNPFVLDGDVIRVGFERLSATVSGAVNRPGRYELTGTRDLAELVGLAGGLAPEATALMPIGVVRRAPDDLQIESLVPFAVGGALPALALEHEDRVQVPRYTDVQESVSVVGALTGVSGPTDPGGTRRLPFARGDSVRTLLDRLGGVSPLADLKNAHLLRNGQAVPVDLEALVMRRDLAADRKLELGDVFVVPFKRRDVLVQGAVFAPGTYPFHPSFAVEQYVALAGGLTRFAEPLSKVRLVSPLGEMKEFDRSLVVEPGSSVVVPERNYSRSEVAQIIISAASVVVGGVAVVLAARR